MPDMDGVHLAREIQKIPELAHTPLIMITGLVPNLGDAELKAAGFRGVLTKPIRQSQAFDTIIATVAERTPDATDTAIRPTASPRPTSAAIASQRSAARLLLAEDNEINQMVAIEVLHRAGFRCDVVSDGQKAVEAAISGTYQVVMMDCQMPTCDGFEAARRIRAAEQQVDPDQPRRHVPIVALTANAIKGDREKCLAAGMDNYMTKPLDPKRLVQLVDFYLGIKGEPPAAKPQAENEWADEEPRPRRKKRRRKIRSAQVPGDAVPIEWDSLFERCMKNTKFVQQMLSEFQAQGSQSVEKIRQSVTARDADQTAKLAHSLKGVAA
jgi:Amt family ammonium transporter